MHHPEEFIGLQLKVISHSNKSLVGLEGKIIDETKKTITIQSEDKQRTILKAGSRFLISGKEVGGDEILQRPEERIKTRR